MATGAVDSVDFKALYHGTVVDWRPTRSLYQRVVAAFPNVWFEDPDLVTAGTAAALADAHDRITWDAPIHSIADIESLPFAPRMVNIKPRRIGGLQTAVRHLRLLRRARDRRLRRRPVRARPGRGQAQYLASLFHPDTPNDLAPAATTTTPARGAPVEPAAAGAEPDRLPLGRARPSIGRMTITRRLGTVALVTGASSGIGEATAIALARRRRRRDRARRTSGSRSSPGGSDDGGTALVIEADVTDQAQAGTRWRARSPSSAGSTR